MTISGSQLLSIAAGGDGGLVDADLFPDLTRTQLEDRLDGYADEANTKAASADAAVLDEAAFGWAYHRVWSAKANDLAKRHAQEQAGGGHVSRTISSAQIAHFRQMAADALAIFTKHVPDTTASASTIGLASQAVAIEPVW